MWERYCNKGQIERERTDDGETMRERERCGRDIVTKGR